MINNKTKAIVLRIIFIAVFLTMCISMFVVELNITGAFMNSLAAFNGVIPSAAVLVSNINWFFVNKYRSKEKFAKRSLTLYVLAYTIGIICGCIHYEMPIILEAFNFYIYQFGLGIILSVFFGIVIYLLSKVYFSLIKE